MAELVEDRSRRSGRGMGRRFSTMNLRAHEQGWVERSGPGEMRGEIC